jgi:hypothetical protein
MKLATIIITALLIISDAQADFSYTTTRKTTAGASVAGTNNQPSKYYFKGRKMKVETGDTAVLIDFRSQTITTLDYKRKTITVRNFGDAGSATQQGDAGAKIDVKETGQTKTIDGHRSVEMLLTTDLDSPELRTMGTRVQMEMDLWLSRDVPGAAELHRFYERNMERFPWRVLSGAGNQTVQTGLAGLQSRVAGMNGVQVLEVVKVKSVGGPSTKPLTPSESGRIRDTIAELDAKVQKGGSEAAAATVEMSRLKAMVGDDFVAGPLFEITVESTGFSTGSIPDSVFAIPSGYQRADAAP